MKSTWYFCAVFLFLSCKHELENKLFYQTENAATYKELLLLTEEKEAVFPGDTNMWQETSIIQPFQEDGKDYIAIFNQFGLKLNIYDYDLKKRVKEIYFEREGPNGVGSKTDQMGCFVIHSDTIIIYNYWERKIKVLNSHSQVFLSKDIPESSSVYFNTIVRHSPPVEAKGSVYFPNLNHGSLKGSLIPSGQMPAFMRFDYRSGNFSFFQQRSEVYDIGYNLAGDNGYVFATYNPDRQKIVYSFRQDQFLYASSLDGKLEKHFVGSKYFKQLEPFSFSFEDGYDKEGAGSDPAMRLYILTSPKYDRILYDEWNKLYYRFAFLPRTREEYEAGNFDFKQSIIIIDTNFQKAGEWMIPSSYSTSSAFVTKDGLLMPKTSENEDQLVFAVLKPVRNEKLEH